MTTTAITHHDNDTSRRRTLRADLVFWTAAGAVVAALSGPLSGQWGVPRAALLGVGLAFAILGPVLLLGLSRMRPTRGMVAAFVVTNFALAPLSAAAAWCGWLGLTRVGNMALGDAAAIMLVLGVWQLSTLRRR